MAAEAGPADGVPLVAVDQFAGAVSATRHLLELGHETVWHIAGPLDLPRVRSSAWRVGGRRSRPPAPWCPSRWSATGARAPATTSAGASAGIAAVTAVFVANDQMALGVLRAMHEAGRESRAT